MLLVKPLPHFEPVLQRLLTQQTDHHIGESCMDHDLLDPHRRSTKDENWFLCNFSLLQRLLPLHQVVHELKSFAQYVSLKWETSYLAVVRKNSALPLIPALH